MISAGPAGAGFKPGRDWNWEDMGCKEKSCENSVQILASLYSCYQNTVSDLCLFFDDKDLNRKFVYDLMVPTLHHKCIERGISQNLKDVLQLDVLSVSRNNSIATELDLTSENNEICIDTAYMICYIVYGIASILLTVVSMLFAVFKNKLKLRRSVSESEHDRTQENILFLNRSL